MLSSPGLGSGLDVNGIVSQLMTIEQRPLTLLANREARQQAQLSAYGSLKGNLSSFQTNVQALNNASLFTGMKAALEDSALASVSADTSAVAGNHQIETQTLAQAQKLKSVAFASTDTAVGSGVLTIQSGTYEGDGTFSPHVEKAAQNITIEPDKTSLADIRNAINNADAGVTASIINDGTGNRLVIASQDTGLSNALKITVNDSDGDHIDTAGLSRLAYDASTGGTVNLSETVAAQNATMVIDGITISKPSNTISDALEGVTFNLLTAKPGTVTNLSITPDNERVEKAVGEFVKGYNDLEKTISNLSRFDAASKQGAVLTGDATLRMIQSRMRGMLNTFQPGTAGGVSSLSQIGISFQKDGTLALDSSKLNVALNDPTQDIAAFFTNQSAVASLPPVTTNLAQTSDSLISIINQPVNFQPGSFAINISQIATQGKAVGNTVATSNINSAPLLANNTLDLSIDDIGSSITLADGAYTADSLVAEIQSKIDSDATFQANGVSATVSHNAGVLSITSSSFGSASNAKITGGNGLNDLFGGVTETQGVDVTGTIGGESANGVGRDLSGSGTAADITLRINGGAIGDRGTVDFLQTTGTPEPEPATSSAPGFAGRLDQILQGMLESDGLLDSRVDGINASIKDIGTQRDAFGRRLEDVERRIRAQFTALDTLIASMSQTSSFLQQQLAGLSNLNQR